MVLNYEDEQYQPEENTNFSDEFFASNYSCSLVRFQSLSSWVPINIETVDNSAYYLVFKLLYIHTPRFQPTHLK